MRNISVGLGHDYIDEVTAQDAVKAIRAVLIAQ
jgi:hypothetical protein